MVISPEGITTKHRNIETRTVTVHATAVGFQDKVREEDAATQPVSESREAKMELRYPLVN